MSQTVAAAGLHRSYLYVVGHREDHIEKAYASDVDAVVLELEDAVAPSRKADARRMVADVLRTAPPKPTWVRVNPLGTGLLRDDLEALAGARLEGVRLPKTQSAADVQTVANWLAEIGSAARIQVILETALGVERVAEIASAHERVSGVHLGEQDLRADVGASAEGLQYARSRVVFAARAAGLPAPVQSVWPDLADHDGLRASCRAGKSHGFYGRSALHPTQVPVIHEVYTPTEAEIAEAEQLGQLLADAVEVGAASLRMPDGRFIDKAIVLAAERTLAYGRRAGRQEPDRESGHEPPGRSHQKPDEESSHEPEGETGR
ncbi:MAG: HpcH/HpaI aldolase/citrate lyase family protein [Micromonosporaceae bacterium]